MRLITTNYCTETSTVVAASSSSVHMPVSNLKNPLRSKRWRSNGLAAKEWVTFDIQSAEPIDSIVMLWPKEDGIRLSDNAIVKIEASATNVWTTPAVSQVLTISNDYSIASHYFASPQNYRYWRVTIEDAGNAYGYVEIGQVILGQHLEFREPENGFKYSLSDGTNVVSTEFGHRYFDLYPMQASMSFDFSYIEYITAQILENAYRTNGVSKPVFVTLDETGTTFNKDHFAVYGNFDKAFGLDHVNGNLFNGGLRITELG